MIHCIGDSHVCFFSGQDKICDDPYLNFRPHRIGAYLAYSLGNPEHDAFKKLMSTISGLPKEDYVMLSFGEIDIRVHVVKQAEKQNRTIESVISEIVDSYSIAINCVLNTGRKVIIWCPIPTCNHYDPSADVSAENPFPHIGKIEERNQANLYFLESLKNSVPEEVILLDLYKELINENMTSKGEYFMDGVHLSQKVMPMILEKFRKALPNAL